MGANILQQLKEVPAAVKWLVGFVTAAVSFVLLLRSHAALGVVIFGALLLAGLFAACAQVAFAMTDPGVGLGRREPRPKHPRARPWAFAAMAAVVVACVLVFVFKPTRYYVVAALAGKHVAPRADVLIGQFDARHATKTYEIPNRLKNNLARELRGHHLDNVTVETFADVITSDAEARASAEQAGSKVVIWGEYDDAGITIKLYTPEPPRTGDVLAMKEVAWGEGSDLSFKLGKQLPENTFFLSLFIIGQLYYQGNEYLKGHQAFDAAMANLPKEIGLENEGLLHFFSARSLEAAGSKDAAKIVCEYARAIELNPKFAAPYINLGIIAVKLRADFVTALPDEKDDLTRYEFPQGSRPCLAKIGYDEYENGWEYFFDKALEAHPDSAVIKYNKLASLWRALELPGLTEDDEIRKTLEEILKKDQSIPGAHVMLGVISFKEKDEEFDEGNYQTAVRAFAAASTLLPGSAELHVNMGKAHQRKGRPAEARAEYEKALALAPRGVESRLALADLALRQGQAGAALEQLSRVNSDGQEDVDDAVQMAAVLKSRTQFQAGDVGAAIQTLRASVAQQPGPPGAQPETDADTSLAYYLIGLIHSLNSNAAAAARAWSKCDFSNLFYAFDDPTPQIGGGLDQDAYMSNETTMLVWYDLLKLCRPTDGDRDVSRWGRVSPCLPGDLRTRIMKVFDLAQDRVAHRIYFRREMLFGDLACPYIFTPDSGRGWRFETTILYRLDGAAREATQTRPLARFDGRLLIREVEPEVSHVDQISVVVEDAAGRTYVLRPQLKSVREADGDYLILRRGDEALLTFADFANVREPRRARIKARGYYVSARDAPDARPAHTVRVPSHR